MTIDAVLARAAFTVDGEPRTWADVVAAATEWGEWKTVEDAVRRPAAAEQPRAAVDRRVTDFRYRHGLLSVDDTEARLADWGLTMQQWLGALNRQARGEAPDNEADAAVAVWAEAITSDLLTRSARRLARQLVEPDAAAAVTSEAVADVIRTHRLDWARFELQQADVGHEDAARELLYCVRDDGRPLPDVARDAGAAVEDVTLVLAEAPDEVRPLLAGASRGDVLGPVAVQSKWRLAVVVSRTDPHADDPATVARAEEDVLGRAVRRALAARVLWVDPLAGGRA